MLSDLITIAIVIGCMVSPYALEIYFIHQFRETDKGKFFAASLLFGIVCIGWSFVFFPFMRLFFFGP